MTLIMGTEMVGKNG